MSRKKEVKLTRRQRNALKGREYQAWREGTEIFCNITHKSAVRTMKWNTDDQRWMFI